MKPTEQELNDLAEDHVSTLRNSCIGGHIIDAKKASFKQGFEQAISQMQPEWLSVKDRLPENQQICTLYSDGTHLTFFKFHEKGHSGNDFHYFSDMNNKGPIGVDEITHWMPLPQPPKD